MKRYQIYYRLVDVSFWITAVWLAFKLLGMTALRIGPLWDVMGDIYIVLYPLNSLLAVFLALAKCMRDELAERIWQTTARRFVNFMIVGPIVACILAAVFSTEFVEQAPQLLHPTLVEMLETKSNAGLHFLLGIVATLFLMAQLIPTIFVLFYRWGLWRDGA
jgi:hypothetical protein